MLHRYHDNKAAAGRLAYDLLVPVAACQIAEMVSVRVSEGSPFRPAHPPRSSGGGPSLRLPVD